MKPSSRARRPVSSGFRAAHEGREAAEVSGSREAPPAGTARFRGLRPLR